MKNILTKAILIYFVFPTFSSFGKCVTTKYYCAKVKQVELQEKNSISCFEKVSLTEISLPKPYAIDSDRDKRLAAGGVITLRVNKKQCEELEKTHEISGILHSICYDTGNRKINSPEFKFLESLMEKVTLYGDVGPPDTYIDCKKMKRSK